MKTIYCLLLCLFISTVTIGQKTLSKAETSVKQLIIDAFDDIWSDLDSMKISQHHTDDFLLLEHGEVWTNETIKNYMARSLEAKQIPKRENRFDFIRFEKNKNSIWVAYHNFATWSIDAKIVGAAQWLESAVAVKTKQGWKLKMLHSTRVEKK